MIYFKKPTSLLIDNLAIVYNIFYSNEFIYIVSNNYFEEDKKTRSFILDFKVNGEFVKYINEYGSFCHETMNIYKIENKWDKMILTVVYKENEYNFDINENNFISEKNDFITLMTLFKNDYYFIPVYLKHYKNLGIKHFNFYFNFSLDELLNLKDMNNIIDEIKKDNEIEVSFIEWNFKYWIHHKTNFLSNAQCPAIADMFFKSKNQYKYIYFNDLDEYLFFKDTNIKSFSEFLDKHKDIDVFQLNMYWSDYQNELLEEDGTISFYNFSNNFNINNFVIKDEIDKNKITSCSKIILKTSHLGCGVHKEIRMLYSNHGIVKTEYKRLVIDGFYHIYNLKEKRRKIK
jgi:hypothetical protein